MIDQGRGRTDLLLNSPASWRSVPARDAAIALTTGGDRGRVPCFPRFEDFALPGDPACVPWLAALWQARHNPDILVFSFDFFDTLVFRLCRHPTDVFLALGGRLAAAGWLSPGVTPRLFQRLRIEAEIRCRQAASARGLPAPEVDLWEIYRHMPAPLFRQGDSDSLVEMEVAEEARLIRPYLPMVQLALELKRLGRRIIIVSDTYLCSRHLKRLLGGYDLFDHVFVSSEHRTGKGGMLFSMIPAILGVEAAQILHLGDNDEADVVSARRFGLQAVHTPSGTREGWAAITQEEQYFTPPGALPPVRENGWDQGLTALRTRLLALSSVGKPTHFSYGAFILGPIIHGWCRWATGIIRDRGCTIVLGCMREGGFMADLLHHLTGMPTSPVFLSRRLVRLATLGRPTVDGLMALAAGRSGILVGEFCTLVGIDPACIDQPADARLIGADRQRRLMEAILDLPDGADRVARTSAAARRSLLAHLLRLAPDLAADGDPPCQPVRIALLDSGWNASIQAGLARLLAEEGLAVELTGLYLMLTDGAVQAHTQNSLALGFLHQPGDPERHARYKFRVLEILEQSLSPDVGSTLQIDAQGRPTVSMPGTPRSQRQQVAAIQQGIASFCRMADAHDLPPVCARNGPDPVLEAIWLRAMTQPGVDELDLFSGWIHDDNLGGGSDLIISPPWDGLAGYMTPGQITRSGLDAIYWPYGAVAQQDTKLLEQTAAVVRQAVPDSLFETPLPIDVSLIEQDGAGHLHAITLPVLLNSHGRFCCALTGTPGRTPVSIRLSGETGLVEIHQCHLVAIPGGNAPQVRVTLTAEAPGLLFQEFVRTADCLLPGLEPVITLDMDRLMEGWPVAQAVIYVAGAWRRHTAAATTRRPLLELLDAAKGWPSRGCFDVINGEHLPRIAHDPQGIVVDGSAMVELSGWLDDNLVSGVGPTLLLVEGGGRRKAFPARRTWRSDVLTALKIAHPVPLGIQVGCRLGGFAGQMVTLSWVSIKGDMACRYGLPLPVTVR